MPTEMLDDSEVSRSGAVVAAPAEVEEAAVPVVGQAQLEARGIGFAVDAGARAADPRAMQ